jgi:nucleotide-binding universal stress UspA family protein
MIKILLAVDGSPPSLQAVRYALGLVEEGLQASFVLANVQPPASLYEMLTAPDQEALREVRAGAGEHALQQAAAMLDKDDVPYEMEVASGEPGPVLAELTERYEVDMVIMGTHGEGATRAALAGSVAHWVHAHTAVPVTLVPWTEQDEA